MRTRTIVIALGCAAVALPAAAQAKGASQARVDGPGLDGDGVVFASDRGGNPSPGSAVARLAAGSGFEKALFGVRSSLQRQRPRGALGPRYTITYTLPGTNGEVFELRQSLYPYAAHGPVVYTQPGQRIWSRPPTAGGWFQARPGLVTLLVTNGLPPTPPAPSESSALGISWPAAGLGVLVVALLGAAVVVAVRRRFGPVAAP